MSFLVHEALFLYEIKYIFIISTMKKMLVSILRQYNFYVTLILVNIKF
ncbi:Uncharacterised protein [Clostridioides difficile]|nr:Uncharacterised protein [Clostridioides difficile]